LKLSESRSRWNCDSRINIEWAYEGRKKSIFEIWF